MSLLMMQARFYADNSDELGLLCLDAYAYLNTPGDTHVPPAAKFSLVLLVSLGASS